MHLAYHLYGRLELLLYVDLSISSFMLCHFSTSRGLDNKFLVLFSSSSSSCFFQVLFDNYGALSLKVRSYEFLQKSSLPLVFCRFLALKNLATVFLQQGSDHYENALRCYLQAVEIDTKDSVVWNQLGTLSCSMGLLSISRWAFEQGLLCSPNNCKHLCNPIKNSILSILIVALYALSFHYCYVVSVLCLHRSPYSLSGNFYLLSWICRNYKPFSVDNFVQGTAWRNCWKFLLLLVMRWHVFLWQS